MSFLPGCYPSMASAREDLVEVLVDRTTGTNIGNMTGGGNLAASFDGGTSETSANSSTRAFDAKPNSQSGYVGKTFGAPKIISRIVIYGSNNQGYISTANVSITLTLYGKNGAAPSSATDGTSLGAITFTDTTNESVGREIASSDLATAWTHVWVAFSTSNSGNSKHFAEIEVYELV